MLVSKFSLFVEIGRVVFINFGEYRNKTAIILEVLDQNRILVHGPTTGVPRHVINLKWIALTKLKLNVLRGARLTTLTNAIKAADLDNKVAQLRISKSVAAVEKKANSSDFERFKSRIAKKSVCINYFTQSLITTSSSDHQNRQDKQQNIEYKENSFFGHYLTNHKVALEVRKLVKAANVARNAKLQANKGKRPANKAQ
ncbi:S60 ribosomal protein L14 [Heterostelium album PN500]|uniref:S60 ribosomal protein L14 n=1 Tax=Heterostelium pallidum (strain ATCC 26659 / Pp 5 / PN500) TaxID=670386 RepID=D3BCT9_HETP5|nr:S60 ribosomal protein L14 [Heterostelium album PN500]EFA80731.1 S60 ribosomal protein L14 [Heterostelium album PN500]|eukprot:XP_020432851.1 S60 ribosomal protein L14 [Heterostelium album PN500]